VTPSIHAEVKTVSKSGSNIIGLSKVMEEGLKMKSTSIVVFGASGDLSQRKLAPGLYSLFRKGRLPEKFNIVGFSTSKMEDDEFKEKLRQGVEKFSEAPFDPEAWQAFSQNLYYQPGSFNALEDFRSLAARLETIETGPANRLFYLATPPRFFSVIVAALGKVGMVSEPDGWRRVVVEKPFGTDTVSARELNNQLQQVLDEDQIYRIDHYLGKETVQNIMTFRFANSLYDPLWNRNFIDHVQITVAEQVDVGTRGGFYDGVGALRDMFQNHIFQLLSIIAMEPPTSFQADIMRKEKVKALSSVLPLSRKDVETAVVRGQYTGYRDLAGVAPDSMTETFVAMRLFLDNPRWQGVPFYLRSGKSLAEKSTEIVIQFKTPPTSPVVNDGIGPMRPNLLSFCLQPDEGFHQRFDVKVPDTLAERRPVEMAFHYRDAFGESTIPEAYERLLLDALSGDTSLFTRGDRAELAWELLEPILEAWRSPDSPPLYRYEPHSWGPAAAENLIEKDGRHWQRVCGIHQAYPLHPVLD
jgi:glucose-6-phosphate 1-dehydrogenase